MRKNEDIDLCRSAARMRRWLTLMLGVAALLLLTERLGYAGAYRAVPPAFPALASAFARQIVFATPAILYLVALWQLRRAAASAARGAPFAPLAAAAVLRVGWLLIGGALTAILLMPPAHRLLGEHYPRLIDYDLANIILAALGLGLIFIARLIRRAATVQGELDQMF